MARTPNGAKISLFVVVYDDNNDWKNLKCQHSIESLFCIWHSCFAATCKNRGRDKDQERERQRDRERERERKRETENVQTKGTDQVFRSLVKLSEFNKKYIPCK